MAELSSAHRAKKNERAAALQTFISSKSAIRCRFLYEIGQYF